MKKISFIFIIIVFFQGCSQDINKDIQFFLGGLAQERKWTFIIYNGG
jgi:hypothetical protein